MALFSERMGFSSQPKHEIVEDAPQFVRNTLFDRVVQFVTVVDRDARYRTHRPVGIKLLLEELSLLRMKPLPTDYEDSWHCAEILKEELMSMEWFYFYDALEMISKAVVNFKRNPDDDVLTDFDSYRITVNDILERTRMAWRVNEKGELARNGDSETRKLEADANVAAAPFDPVREHLLKAKRYIESRPADSANSIKESVSAVESFGKFIYPSTSTLGDVIGKMRSQGQVPSGLVTVIEKYYAFANQEPAVRHGGVSVERVQLSDAEYCYNIALSTITYLSKRLQ